jgi:hypothetical protein
MARRLEFDRWGVIKRNGVAYGDGDGDGTMMREKACETGTALVNLSYPILGGARVISSGKFQPSPSSMLSW